MNMMIKDAIGYIASENIKDAFSTIVVRKGSVVTKEDFIRISNSFGRNKYIKVEKKQKEVE